MQIVVLMGWTQGSPAHTGPGTRPDESVVPRSPGVPAGRTGSEARQIRLVGFRDQTNLSCLDLPAYPLVAQGPKLDLALHGIARGKLRLHVPGVTGELGYALADLCVHEVK